MLRRCKGIIFAIILGLVCPTFIIGFLQKNERETQIFPTETTQRLTDNQPEPLEISVLMNDNRIQLLDINDYLTCVVLREMPASFEPEALKAQAVVARTYALRRQASGGKHDDAAVCTNSDCCQGYYDLNDYLNNGGTKENIDKIRNAVELTDNLVLVYNGELIDATYYACSGGMTEDAKAVWGVDVPYLQSTVSPGEEKAAHYVDTVTFRAADFMQKLKLSANKQLQIGKITYTSGGGVDKINICGEEFKGTELRRKLGLRSTAFVISVVGNTVTVTTKGYGHRVGMSQYGADAMAVNGSAFPDILAHYYRGTQLVTYNGN